jgi:hypothetical protein
MFIMEFSLQITAKLQLWKISDMFPLLVIILPCEVKEPITWIFQLTGYTVAKRLV